MGANQKGGPEGHLARVSSAKGLKCMGQKLLNGLIMFNINCDVALKLDFFSSIICAFA